MTWGRTRNQVGKPVYRASSYAPNRGQVNPQGYLQRELRKRNQGVSRTGRDGQSDTRSGLARNALARMPTRQRSAPLPSPIQRPNYSLLAGGGSSPTAGRQVANAPVNTPAPAPMPTIAVSPVGNLELPWEEASNYEAIQQQQQYQQAMQEMQLTQQQQQAEWVRAVQLANEQYEKQKVNRVNDSSGRGVAFSSAHGVGVNEDAYEQNNMLNELNTGNSNNINSFNLGINGIQNSWRNSLQNMAHQRGLRAAENAAALAQQEEQARQQAAQAALVPAQPASPPVANWDPGGTGWGQLANWGAPNNNNNNNIRNTGWGQVANWNNSRNINGGKNKPGRW